MKNAYRLVIVCVFLLAGMVMVSAQTDNLLTNPGFEAPFDAVETSTIATGWTPWFIPAAEGMNASDNVMPEYFAASDTVNGLSLTPRIHGGEDAQQYFSYYSTHTGGLYQEVTGITVGTQLAFSTFANLWASDASETSDGSGEILFSVGIDANGGTDGESADIVWSDSEPVYDNWSEYSVSAVAQADTVTVFIRSTATAKIANNVIYVDDATLAAVSGDVPVAVATEDAGVIEVTEAPIEVTVEVMTEIAPVEVTVEAMTEIAPIEVTVEVMTEVAAIEVTVEATVEVILPPTVKPTVEPTLEPTIEPTVEPTVEPTIEPTVEAIVEATPAGEIQATVEPTQQPSPTLNTTTFPQAINYIVQSGDTVVDLALRYGSSIEAITIANGLNEFAFIVAGQSLIIPVMTLPAPTLPPTVVPPTVVPPTVVPPTIAPTLVPTLIPTVAVVGSEPIAVGEPVTYVIQFGDSLSSIAARFGTTTRELARLNGITNPELIYYGQLLVISVGSPTPFPTMAVTRAATQVATPVPTAVTGQSYRVQPGDNLYVISLRFGVTVASIVQANNLENPNRLFVGQMLIIPQS